MYLGKKVNAELLNQIPIYAAAVVVSLIRLTRLLKPSKITVAYRYL